jgi:tetratricopeptide (TPR) repeat protein
LSSVLSFPRGGENTAYRANEDRSAEILTDCRKEKERFMHSAPRQRCRRVRDMALLTAVAAATLSVFALPYTEGWQNARLSRLPVEQLRAGAGAHQNDPIYLYWLGRGLNERQQFEDAEAVLHRAAGLDPDSPRIRDEWARAQQGAGSVTDAYTQLRQFAGTHPQSAEAQFFLGKYHFSQEAWGAARTCLEQAVALTPNHAEAWSLLANVRFRQKYVEDGVVALRRAISLDPTNAVNRLEMGAYLSSRNPEQARKEYEYAVTLRPDWYMARRELALFLLDKGQSEAAEAQARQAVTLNPTDPYSQLALGRAALTAGKAQEAVAAFHRAAELAPGDPLSAQGLQQAYHALGNRTQSRRWGQRFVALQSDAAARQRLKNTLRSRPADPEGNRKMAELLAKVGDTAGVVRHLALATRAPADAPTVLITAARLLLRTGTPQSALPAARQAVQNTARNPDAHETLGDCLLAMGRLHEAAVQFDLATHYRPEQAAAYRSRVSRAAARRAALSSPGLRLYRESVARWTAQNRPQGEERVILELARQAARAEPEDTAVLRHLMRAAYRWGSRDEAIEVTNRLLTLSPEDGVAHAYAALLVLQRPRAEAHAAEDQRASYAWGLLALRRDRPADAVTFLRTAATLLEGRMPEVYRDLAAAERLTGNRVAADAAHRRYRSHLSYQAATDSTSADRTALSPLPTDKGG